MPQNTAAGRIERLAQIAGSVARYRATCAWRESTPSRHDDRQLETLHLVSERDTDTVTGPVLYALRVVAPLMIAFVLLQRGVRLGRISGEEYEERIAWLRLLAMIGAALFGILAAIALVAAITSRG